MMQRFITYLGCACVGIGLGFGMALAFFLSDDPSIIIEERWRTVTTAPPVTYRPETPFHIDRKVICDPYVPPTTTSVAPVLVPTPTEPLSTSPPSSTTSTSSTALTETPTTVVPADE